MTSHNPTYLLDPRLPREEVLVVLHQAEVHAQVKRVRRIGRPAQQGEQLPPQRLLGRRSGREVCPRNRLNGQYLRRYIFTGVF